MYEHILIDPKVCHGQACIKGTRIPLMTVKALGEVGHEVLDIRGTESEGASGDTLWKDEMV